MKRALRLVALLLAAIVAIVAAVVGWAMSTEYRPGPQAPAIVECPGAPAAIVAGEPFTIISWNLQYGGSRKYHFFYDGGDAVKVDKADVDATMTAIAGVLRREAPTLALLQEIDRGSDRTHQVDELPALVTAVGAACEVTASYHRSPFVPSPTTNPMGKVDMNLGLLSLAPLKDGLRIQLPLLAEPRYRQMFNLKRALLTATVEVDGIDQPLALAVTHLSAFSHGDGTLARQVAALDAWMSSRPAGQPWILAGDLNLLPPGDDPGRLSTESDLYADAKNPVDELFAKYTEIFGDAQLDPANRTYLPFGTTEPDRKIDYVFVGGPVHVLDARVLREDNQISDHLPMRARLVLGDLPAPAPADGSEGEAAPPLETAVP